MTILLYLGLQRWRLVSVPKLEYCKIGGSTVLEGTGHMVPWMVLLSSFIRNCQYNHLTSPSLTTLSWCSSLCLLTSQRQQFLHTHLHRLLKQYFCNHTVIVGDLNHHLDVRTFKEFLTVHGLTNQITLPIHPQLQFSWSHFHRHARRRRSFGDVGSSDHLAVLSTFHVGVLREMHQLALGER